MTASAASSIDELPRPLIVTDTYEYDGFGNEFTVSGSTSNNYLYRGEQYDPDLGLYYLRARYYNPLTGRFLSRDPEDGDYSDPATLHKYLYASADPVNLIDPSGRADLVDYSFLQKVAVASTASLLAYKAAIVCLYGWDATNFISTVDTGLYGGQTQQTSPCQWIWMMAKGGKQNIQNEITREAQTLFGNNRRDICKWLDDLYATADPKLRQKIIKAQKFFGCRRSGGGGN